MGVADRCACRGLLADRVSAFVHRNAGLKPEPAKLGWRRRAQRFCRWCARGVVFRGLILSLLLSANSDDQRLSDVWRAILISSVLFSVPHVLNLFAGHAEARVAAQLIWAFLLGVVFACLRIAGRSIWPVAVLHGGMNAFVHVNRLGIEIQPSLLCAAALAFAPIPLCIYGAILLRKRR
jgi:hypothetical protein